MFSCEIIVITGPKSLLLLRVEGLNNKEGRCERTEQILHHQYAIFHGGALILNKIYHLGMVRFYSIVFKLMHRLLGIKKNWKELKNNQ